MHLNVLSEKEHDEERVLPLLEPFIYELTQEHGGLFVCVWVGVGGCGCVCVCGGGGA